MANTFFPTTGVQHTRKNEFKSYNIIMTGQRRVESLFRTNRLPSNVAGQQINADYILYSIEGDNFRVGDRIEFNLDDMNEELDFNKGNNQIICEVKENPIKYGFVLNGYKGEVFLKTIN